MKTLLKEINEQQIWIEGFNNIDDYQSRYLDLFQPPFEDPILYAGNPSEISEEIAKDCLKECDLGHIIHYPDFKKNLKSTKLFHTVETAKKSILSACSSDLCIIYEESILKNVDDINHKITYWAERLSYKSLSTEELLKNVKWLIEKVAYTEEETQNLCKKAIFDYIKDNDMKGTDFHQGLSTSHKTYKSTNISNWFIKNKKK